ncbi:MAG: HNH endonuclease [Chloroflexota bacterium]|nr:MAG: HNH endonuclease [Chloroflexota bacterium]
MSKSEITQEDLVKEFFVRNPNRAIKHPEVVDWLTAEYLKRTGKVFRDPDRAIRKLSQQGFLIKDGKGIYRYDPLAALHRELEDFTEEQKEIIKKRDGYRCVQCGKGIAEGLEIHVDHIKAKELGGRATIENGQTLCAPHNFMKKISNQTESGKKMFIRLYELAKTEGNADLLAFTAAILEVFEKYDVNGHIEWKR